MTTSEVKHAIKSDLAEARPQQMQVSGKALPIELPSEIEESCRLVRLYGARELCSGDSRPLDLCIAM